MHPKDADRKANSIDPDQTVPEADLGLHCLLRSACPKIELPHDKTNKMACGASEDSDQPGHLLSLIRVFAVRMKKAWILSYSLSTQQRL